MHVLIVRKIQIFGIKRLVNSLAKIMVRKASKPSSEEPPKKKAKIVQSTISKYFQNNDVSFEDKYIDIQLKLNEALAGFTFKPPVKYMYNPVIYAFKGNEAYIRKYCKGPKKLLFVGMNPGPFGMCQTGVPFGDVEMVRDWLKITAEIGKPTVECPQREIKGFSCPRSEVSGHRLWNVLKKLFKTPETFFKNSFVFNYCPLAFMKVDGANVTPTEMKGEQVKLEEICDEYFHKIIQLINPEIIIGIGGYAEKRTQLTMKRFKVINKKLLRLPHPSPRAANNHNWPEKAEKFFQDNELLKYFQDAA